MLSAKLADGNKPTVSVIGAGNANDHYRATNRMPMEELLGSAEPRPIDLLKITHEGSEGNTTHYAHSYAGIGVSPRVAQELNRYKLNPIKEVYILLKTLFTLRPVRISHDGVERRIDSLVFANIHEMAKILTLHTKTNLHDGQFEVVEIPHGNFGRFLLTLLKAAVFSLGEQQQYRTYSLTLVEQTPLQIDGEIVSCKAGDTLTVSVAKDAIMSLH